MGEELMRCRCLSRHCEVSSYCLLYMPVRTSVLSVPHWRRILLTRLGISGSSFLPRSQYQIASREDDDGNEAKVMRNSITYHIDTVEFLPGPEFKHSNRRSPFRIGAFRSTTITRSAVLPRWDCRRPPVFHCSARIPRSVSRSQKYNSTFVDSSSLM
ncbi:hypothetical protein BC834DRAFT_905835 [Gloeopeniophorella convolvens]|nr:hypothetical protein BC834DRAFT_905835 [Gloeopeniophorella convolvens]